MFHHIQCSLGTSMRHARSASPGVTTLGTRHTHTSPPKLSEAPPLATARLVRSGSRRSPSSLQHTRPRDWPA